MVVEEFLTGEEASFFAFIDGENCIPLVGAQVGRGRSGQGGRRQVWAGQTAGVSPSGAWVVWSECAAVDKASGRVLWQCTVGC